MVEEMDQRGMRLHVQSLAGTFPEPDDLAFDEARRLAGLMTADDVPIIDGLALLAFDPAMLPKRWVALIHHPLHLESGLTVDAKARIRIWETGLIRKASLVICTSGATSEALVRMGLDRQTIRVIEPGCDPQTLTESGDLARRWLCVGSITPRKNQHRLAELMASVVKQLPQTCTLTLVGDDTRHTAYANKLRSILAGSGLKHRVHLTGAVDNHALRAYYRSHDLFLLPSLYEGYGMAITEAVSYGLPVIASGEGAVRQTVEHHGGRFIHHEDTLNWQKSLVGMTRNTEQYQALRSAVIAGRHRLTSWSERAGQFLEALQEG